MTSSFFVAAFPLVSSYYLLERRQYVNTTNENPKSDFKYVNYIYVHTCTFCRKLRGEKWIPTSVRWVLVTYLVKVWTFNYFLSHNRTTKQCKFWPSAYLTTLQTRVQHCSWEFRAVPWFVKREAYYFYFRRMFVRQCNDRKADVLGYSLT